MPRLEQCIEAIEQLRALILGTPPPPPLPEQAVPPEAPPVEAAEPLPIPQVIPNPIQTDSPQSSPSRRQGPQVIPFNDDELDDSTVIGADDLQPQQRYNLRSQARHIIQSAIADGLVIPKDHIAFAVIDE